MFWLAAGAASYPTHPTTVPETLRNKRARSRKAELGATSIQRIPAFQPSLSLVIFDILQNPQNTKCADTLFMALLPKHWVLIGVLSIWKIRHGNLCAQKWVVHKWVPCRHVFVPFKPCFLPGCSLTTPPWLNRLGHPLRSRTAPKTVASLEKTGPRSWRRKMLPLSRDKRAVAKSPKSRSKFCNPSAKKIVSSCFCRKTSYWGGRKIPAPGSVRDPVQPRDASVLFSVRRRWTKMLMQRWEAVNKSQLV